MNSPSFLPADDVLAFLKTRRANVSTPDVQERQNAYRQAASVLAAIDDLDHLRPFGASPGKPGEARLLLQEELVPATDDNFGGKVMLRHDSRKEALAQLGTRDAMLRALEENPDERKGSVQTEFERLLQSPEPIPTEKPAETLQAVLWLEGILDGLPSVRQLRRQLSWRRLIEPFENLAGDAVFRGRVRELDQLRKYVGVVPPESLLERFGGWVSQWFLPDARPAVSVSGPGGVGKSTLVARFMLEHSRVPSELRVPFAYLDFERVSLNVAQPITLIIEMLRQLNLQFPDLANGESLMQFVQSQFAEAQITSISDDAPEWSGKQVEPLMMDIMEALQATLGMRPYVVVLDTFEEVQYRGESRAFPFWKVLQNIQQRWPSLRVVISGRSPVTTLTLAGSPPVPLLLGDLDDDAAVAFLKARGVEDGELVRSLVKQVGGVPLSLKLVASLYQREHLDDLKSKGVSGKSIFWFSASDEVIQGQLYERILGHIHDPRVERLAHPGLVLRRVSPEVIFEVLNEPCHLELRDMDEAREVFAELRNETTIVASDSLDGALIHRPDLRRMMLKLLIQKAPEKVQQIHHAAVKFYSSAPVKDWRNQAEEWYHRLQLGDSLPSTIARNPEIRASLQISISEFPQKVQIALAGLGFQIAPEILTKASREQQDVSVAAQVEELLPYDDSSAEQAFELIRNELPLDRSSPLHVSAARVAAQEDHFSGALEHIDTGVRWAAQSGDSAGLLILAGERAWLLQCMEQWADLDEAVGVLEDYAKRHEHVLGLAQAVFQRYRLASREDKKIPPSANQMANIVARLSSLELWNLFPAFADALEGSTIDSPDIALFPGLIRQAFVQDDSPFLRSEFPSARANRALEQLCNFMQSFPEVSLPSDSKLEFEFHGLVRSLRRVWPYRILNIQPPYGRRRQSFGSERLS